MIESFTVSVNGREETASGDETILDLLRRLGIETPTLCQHDALAPAAACRACVVELKGSRVLAAACQRRLEPGMEIRTDTDRVESARRGVFELLLGQGDTAFGPALLKGALSLGASADTYTGERYLPGMRDDNDLFVRDYDRCILCMRCIEACGPEVQNAFALALSGRGFDTGIAAGFGDALPASACVFCGNCVAVCPTGALMDRREYVLRKEHDWEPEEQEIVQTTCSYCGVGCQLELHIDRSKNEIVQITSPFGDRTSQGFLCVKGRYGYSFVTAGSGEGTGQKAPHGS